MARKQTSRKSTTKRKRRKDPAGGLTAAGRRYFKKKEGAHLRPGVKRAKSREDMRRKGSFLRRFYGRKKTSPLTNKKGEPTRYAKAAHAWGEPVPKNQADVKRLARKGSTLLERAQQTGTQRTARRKK